jgi:TolA-binding protein
MYKIALTMMAMGYQEDARVWFEELIKTFPKSELVRDSKARVAELEKAKKDKKTPAAAGAKKGK